MSHDRQKNTNQIDYLQEAQPSLQEHAKALVLRRGVSSPLDETLSIQDNHEQNEDTV